tara:strand:+ start:2772 stop:3005 length:234 start_codon:yes stop_codon:yes gene_type:complete
MKKNDLKSMGKSFTKCSDYKYALLILLDFTFHRHEYFSFAEIYGFPAFFGFVSFVFIVMLGKWLRKFLMRKEDYYDQ